MVAGAGALVYLLWKNNKAKPKGENHYSTDELGMPMVTSEFELKINCERSGGTWVQPNCIAAPCRGVCAK